MVVKLGLELEIQKTSRIQGVEIKFFRAVKGTRMDLIRNYQVRRELGIAKSKNYIISW